MSNGKLDKVYHFDSKAAVEDYIRSLGIPASFYLAGFFMSNLPGQMMRQNEDGTWILAFPVPPTASIPFVDTEDDTGKFVKGMLLNRDKVLGKRIYGAQAYYTPQQLIEEFKEVKPEAGKGAQAIEISHEEYKAGLAQAGLPDFVQEELLQNMRLLDEYGYYGGAPLDESHSVRERPR